ncbi:dihydrolipoyl dehydrogenase [Erysipelothrix urinaevulpis]|uniref:dihydrolipoyl dehydrogenase n=1 Tax=Erysipelothrix urinaevulpis TaxID=2683717 RepID=UPI001358CFA9|nr:dihydrolipoyl dehydrogenase [Erysipelothrix urinaevulpis]
MVVGDFAKKVDLIVIGSGPGGYVAAIRAAQLGQKVTIVEKDSIGGACLNVGCIPSKAMIHASSEFAKTKEKTPFGLDYGKAKFDMKKAIEWKDNSVVKGLTGGIAALLKKNKIEIVQGEAHFMSEERVRVVRENDVLSFDFKNAIVATGSRPIQIPGFKFGKRVLDSTAALELNEVPKTMTIVGGGYIGCELAGVFANLGTEITILEGADNILPIFDKDLSSFVVNKFKEQGATIHTNVKAEKAVQSKENVKVDYSKDGKTETIESDYVLVTVGRRPNTDDIGLEYAGVKVDDKGLILVDDQGRTNVSNIFAIGDVIAGPALAHKASYEAKVVADVIAGNAAGFDYTVIPSVSYTNPEIAVVGMNVKEAKAEGIKAKAYKFPYAANGRALSMNDTLGFVRITVDEDSKFIVGAEIVGAQASELLTELTMAIETQLTVEDLTLIIHTHPSLSEMIMDTAELAMGLPIHL